jgi:pimeloyl-ACP methyl ester carboxylesterase
MTATSGPSAPSAPRVLDAAALLADVADELVVRTVRDTHLAWADRVHGAVRAPTRGVSSVPETAHRGIASAVYAGLGVGLRATSRGLGALAARDLGPALEDTRQGRFMRAAVNGLIGDRLARERPRLAVPLAVRRDARDVPMRRDALSAAFPHATGRVAVLLHGLSESETAFDRHRDLLGTTYAETLTDIGWTPVLLRANTGLALRENGVALSALLDRLVEMWPVEIERLALVGHSQGGLVIRAACAVVGTTEHPWTDRLSDVVTLGTPHLGAPLAAHVGAGARILARTPESAAFGRILDQRSVGVLDLVEGLGEEVPALPGVRYHLVAATVTRSPRHPVGWLVGDLLVRSPSAHGRARRRPELFPGADEVHLPRAGHLDLLNHPDVHVALRTWLAGEAPPRAKSAVREQGTLVRGCATRSG